MLFYKYNNVHRYKLGEKKSIFKVENNKTLQFIVYLLISDIWKHEFSHQNESVKIKFKKMSFLTSKL